MEKIILIKYGELTTKKGNRNYFINTLYNNIKDKLKDYEVNIHKDRAYIYIECLEKDLESIKKIISNIFGIHTFYIAYIVDSTSLEIEKEILNIMKNETFKTFKIEVKRSDKNFPIHSQDYNRVLANILLKNIKDIKVDVHNPEKLIRVEIREKKTFIYFDKYMGSGGYPVGVQSKGLLMLSGGIDSPVAGYLSLKRGMNIECIYFEAMPHTSIEARNKVIKLTKELTKFGSNMKLHVINFTKIQEEIYKNVKEDYIITIMRRMMYRIMDRLTKKLNALVIINGESIGQVASQTLTSMRVINEVTNVPVIRPLACFDKLEIIDIARKIDTYPISIIPYEDCCTVFVPKHPIINPKLEVVKEEEKKLDFDKYIEEAINSIMTLDICEKEESDFVEIL